MWCSLMGPSLLRPQQNDLAVSLCFKLLLLNGPVVPKSCIPCAKDACAVPNALCFVAPKLTSHPPPPPTSSVLSVHHTQKKCWSTSVFMMFFYEFPLVFLFFSAVMEFQVQINNIKAKLQDTRARKKQQELLIMKVENQALKVSSKCTFPPPSNKTS